MDRIVIERRLESLRRCVARIKSKRPVDLAGLINDLDAQDVLVLNLSRAVQLCVDIGAHIVSASEAAPPPTMGETFSRLADLHILDATLAKRLRGAVGFRNIAVHNYEVIDWAIVHALADVSVHDFEAFARQVSMQLPQA